MMLRPTEEKKAQLRCIRVAHTTPVDDLLPLLETLDLDAVELHHLFTCKGRTPRPRRAMSPAQDSSDFENHLPLPVVIYGQGLTQEPRTLTVEWQGAKPRSP